MLIGLLGRVDKRFNRRGAENAEFFHDVVVIASAAKQSRKPKATGWIASLRSQ